MYHIIALRKPSIYWPLSVFSYPCKILLCAGNDNMKEGNNLTTLFISILMYFFQRDNVKIKTRTLMSKIIKAEQEKKQVKLSNI